MVTGKLNPNPRTGWFADGLAAIACLVLVCFSSALWAEDMASLGQATLGRALPAWTAQDIAVIVNDKDKLSVQIANYYQSKRNIPSEQIIHVSFEPGTQSLSEGQFKTIKQQVDKQTPVHVQGYVLTWLLPFRVEKMSITTAFAAGFDQAFSASGCKETRHNPYFNSVSSRPFNDYRWRPTMVLAGIDFDEAKRLIDRGIAADYSQPKGTAYLLKTTDVARSSRAIFFPTAAKALNNFFSTNYLEKNFIENKKDVMFYFTGLMQVQKINQNTYLPGAVADHLTSTGGVLIGGDQMSILRWIEAGATGSYGAVVEPCNFPEKFSNPGLLMYYYLRGSSLIEAYWRSVAEPGQGIFVGEPLAKPFAKPSL
jgi:uncharacterized protein (TIGR03790 family)